ncbi:uncharacterized protein LOC9640435 isoform X1 [Selaginella moellendorffii]|uniref:uncharacterized protein LOC9640435 isoform X1 n=1 Tax=Selaginella moellendorffii TaxID=88036 RepID=UPI000D1C6C98|nr:uncharacterized protein LOC9640435 isoform X1 [Selaginella moellendorffii]|eukprot:XP_024532741.1 uncharacterized protein LOC9640435 isoform X1 [Selaginella moellendorffii]
MSCNQKTSTILKAATVYLGGQGKKSLGSRASAIFAGEVPDDDRADSFLAERSFLPVGRAAGLFPSELAEITDRKPPVVKRSDPPALEQQQHGKKQQPESKDDVPVEILGLPEAEGVRTDRDEQASECSSSFGFSDATSGDEANTNNASEVDSAARDGNGALETDRRRPLNMDWKNYRRGIEWRCRWLDIRLMELQRQATKYDEVLSGIQKAKPWDGRTEPDGAARAAPVREERPAQPLLHRQRRRKVEETVDVADYMSKHPLFQRYEKKKREYEGEQHKEPNDCTLAAEGAMVRLDPPPADEANEDSVENIMLKVETLQARVVRLRNQLRGSMSHKLPGQVARAGGGGGGAARAPAAKAAAVSRLTKAAPSGHPVSPAAVKGGQAARRRASDYDINNVVMPVSVGAKYVQHVRHANIETPQWRLAEKSEMCEEDNSDDEDTDDETYKSRHAPLEAQERLHRYGPRTNKRPPEGEKLSARGSGSHQMPQCSLSAQFSEG